MQQFVLDTRRKDRDRQNSRSPPPHPSCEPQAVPLLDGGCAKPGSREGCQSFSGSNRLPGKIASIRSTGLLAEVVVAIGECK
jgi:hypothetical protein